VHQQFVKIGGWLSPWRLSGRAWTLLAVFLLAPTVLIVLFGGGILDHYVKRKTEQAFDKAYPGSVLRIGRLDYSLSAHRLIAQSVTLSATNSTLKVGRISVLGLRWAGLLWGTPALADVLAKANLDATNLDLEFPQTHYGIRCARLQSSVPRSELIAEGTELRTLGGDEEFFAAHDYRTTRFHLIIPECRVLGLEYGELFAAKSYRAGSIQLLRPSFDALVDLDKPADPFQKSPLMVNEALAAIRQPLQVDSLSTTDGSVRYGERLVPGVAPGMLTFGAIDMTIDGIANRGESAIVLRATGNFMDAGPFNFLMAIPITPADLSLRYSGSLGAMNLTNLDAFLAVDPRTRIRSGTVKEAAFDINVTAGQARGHVRASYQNLEIALLDQKTGAENGFDDRIDSFVANALKIRSANAPNALGLSKEGAVSYIRKPADEFQEFLWFALRTGVLDIISH
jgi:hypothetical protein